MDRPILFQPWKARKILDWDWDRWGYMQTRRLAGLQQFNGQPNRWRLAGKTMEFDGGFEYVDLPVSRYGVRGDRLWVKETFGINDLAYVKGPLPKTRPFSEHSYFIDPVEIVYRADGEIEKQFEPEIGAEWNWRPSIFMPRWASRITIEVAHIKVERLQDISPNDVIAEGIEQTDDGSWLGPLDGHPGFPYAHAHEAYAALWDSINGKKVGFSWGDNPWLWVITFRMVQTEGLD